MKFLVSGSLQRNTNLKRALKYVLILFICFDILHAFAFVNQSDRFDILLDSKIESPILNVQKSDDESIPNHLSLTAFKLEQSTLENLHMDIFLFAIQYIFCISLVFQLQMNANFRQLLLHTTPLTLLCWVLLRFGIQGLNAKWASIAWGITSAAFYCSITGLGLWTLFRLGWHNKIDSKQSAKSP